MTTDPANTEIADQRVRDLAVTDFGSNLVVTAGAGTGKTSLLVERALMAILREAIPIERMLALTFTEKAAAEMRIRIAGGLERLSMPARGKGKAPAGDSLEARLCSERLRAEGRIAPDVIRARAREAVNHLDGARIGTIHGFCAELLRKYPQAAGVDPFFEIDKGPAFDRQFDQAWDNYIGGELGPGAPRPDSWRSALAHFSLDQLRRLARALGDFRIPLDSINLEAPATPRDDLAEAVSLVLPFAITLRRDYLRSGFVTFDGLLTRTRDLLRDHPELRARVRQSIDAILVDEFQDTDPLQYEIVFYLAEEKGGQSREAYQTNLAPGRLFIVGDPKQSIYRFRGADMSAYARAVDHLMAGNGKALTLSSSFRAPASVLRPINEMFSKVIGPDEGGAAGYEPPYEAIISALKRSSGKESGVDMWSVTSASGKAPNADARRLLEGRAIAQWIRRGVDGGGFHYADTVLLFRALTHVDHYLRALREWDVPFVVQGGSALRNRPEIADLVSLLRTLVNPNDPVALLAVLRSPLGGCSDADLLRFKARGHAVRLQRAEGFDEAEFPEISTALRMLRRLKEMVRALPVDAGLRAILEQTPFLELNACSYHGAQRVANLRHLIERIADVALRESLSLEATLDLVEKEILVEGGEGDSPLADETVEAVRVLTIHSAKGLEFPIVFLPDLAREDKKRGLAGVARWIESRGANGHHPSLALNLGGVVNSAWSEAENEENLHRVAEEKRVFYVACTRARERLILVNGHPKPRSGAVWLKHIAAWGYTVEGEFPPAGDLEAGVRHLIVKAPPRRERASEAVDVSPLARAVRNFEQAAEKAALSTFDRLLAPSGMKAELALIENEGKGRASVPAPGRDRGEMGRVTGIAIHAALAVWNFRNRAEMEEHLTAACLKAAAEAQIPPEELMENGHRIVARFLASELPARFAQAEILGREIPMLLSEGEKTWWGWIDLLMREHGKIIIADWKTDADESFSKTGPERYAGQLGVYARAVQGALDLPAIPRCELVHIPTATVIPVSIT